MATFPPELLPWVAWSYSSPPLLWQPLGCVGSQTGVQQGDPLGPMVFAIVLYKLVSSIDVDDGYLNLIFQTWYLDDGVLAGNHTGLLPACFATNRRNGFHSTNSSVLQSSPLSSWLPNLDILGAPIGDYLFCATSLRRSMLKPRSCCLFILEMADRL